MTALRSLSLVVGVLVLVGCQGGNGVQTTTQREVPAFRRVTVGWGIVVKASPGARAVSFTVDGNLQDQYEAVVEGDALVLRAKATALPMPSKSPEAKISNDVFEGVDASGGAHVTLPATAVDTFVANASGGSVLDITGLSSTALTVASSGGSSVTVAGAATRATVSASGGGPVDLRGVPLQTLQVDASGGSTVRARVSGALTGSASGGSSITITGMPTNQVATSGGSTVTLGAP